MISIIVSSYKEENLVKLKNNIEATVGVPFQFIPVINKGTMGLCEAYNAGAEQAAFPYLCFVHDDVFFHSHNWGNIVIQNTGEPKTGVVGVMGGRYKSSCGLGWRDGRTSFYRMKIVSGSSGGKHQAYNPYHEAKSRVICLDGAFLCCRKPIWEQFRFDADNFKGFHFYDIDFTFRVGQQFENYVLFDIVIEHFSSGNCDERYIKDSLVFERKFSENLPFTLEELSKKEIIQLEGYALGEKLMLMKKAAMPLKLRLKLIRKYFFRYCNFYQLIRHLYFGMLKA
jgi:hypothetical protein